MKVCVVGSLSTIFTHCYIIGLKRAGCDVSIINTSSSISEYKDPYIPLLNTKKRKESRNKKKFHSVIAKLKKNKIICSLYEILTYARCVSSRSSSIDKFLVKNNPNKILFFWGTSTRTELFQIKNAYRNLTELKDIECPELILDVATYPVRDYITEANAFFMRYIDKDYFSHFNKVLSHSDIMDRFLVKNIGIEETNLQRFICTFPKEAYFKSVESKIKVKSKEKIHKKIIFLGAFDPSNPNDDISREVDTLLSFGLEIYVQKCTRIKFSEKVKYFEPLSFDEILSGQFGEFISSFDGILMTYGQMSRLREKLTYPTRLAVATLGLVPIYIPSGRFDSIKEIVRNSGLRARFYSEPKDIFDLALSDYNIQSPSEKCIDDKIYELLVD